MRIRITVNQEINNIKGSDKKVWYMETLKMVLKQIIRNTARIPISTVDVSRRIKQL